MPIKKSFEDICKEISDKDKNAKILTSKETFLLMKGNMKTIVDWKCGGCDRQQKPKNVASIVNEPFCRTCKRIINDKNAITHKKFSDLLEDNGWKMVSDQEYFINTKTKLNVVCVSGHYTTSSYNSFRAGVRCIKCL